MEQALLSMPATPLPTFAKEAAPSLPPPTAKHAGDHAHHHHHHEHKKKKKKHKHKHKHKHTLLFNVIIRQYY